jgi:serine/threonine protein kinase
MDHSDHDLIPILIRTSSIAEVEAPALLSWWTNDRIAEESLAKFLRREGILSDGASRMIDLCRKGYLQIDAGTLLVEEEGRLRLRQGLIPRPEPIEPEPAQVIEPIRMTIRPDRISSRSTPTERPVPVPVPTQEPAEMGLKIGEKLGKYLLTEEVGRGGFGVVYRALHCTLKTPVAIKRLLAEADPEVIESFRAEAITMACLNHPNVVRVLDFADEAVPYVVLEYVEGPSLRDLIKQSGRLRVDRAIAIILQIARGLEASATQGIVHRDVTPSNILLTRDGIAKLTDFGLAAFMADLEDSPDRENRGTAAYMSPEQARGDVIDARSDQYSLGSALYHALTGFLPFPGQNRMEVLLRHATETPVPASNLVPGLDPAVSDLIQRMMEKNPDRRFANFGLVIAHLEALSPSTSESNDRPTSGVGSSTTIKKSAWLGRLVGFGRERTPSVV